MNVQDCCQCMTDALIVVFVLVAASVVSFLLVLFILELFKEMLLLL
jgi:hypothetical protein